MRMVEGRVAMTGRDMEGAGDRRTGRSRHNKRNKYRETVRCGGEGIVINVNIIRS